MNSRSKRGGRTDDPFLLRTLEHIRVLSVDIDPRPSATSLEKRAADYCARIMREAGLRDVRLERFDSFRSTYAPIRRIFGGISLYAEGRPGSGATIEHKHWHRMSDTLDKLDGASLSRVHAYVWELLHYLDRGQSGSHSCSGDYRESRYDCVKHVSLEGAIRCRST